MGCSAGSCPYPSFQTVIPIVGILLVIDGIVCFVGFRQAFPVGVIFSVLTVALVVVGWGSQINAEAASVVVAALIALVLNIAAVRSRGAMSEQGNPMNLPVFG